MILYSLNHFKSVFAAQFFVLPADTNALLARWTFIHGLYNEFSWQAAQATEKYLKAGLILNGEKALGHSHNLSDIYEKYAEIYQDLVPVLSCPNDLEKRMWKERFLEDILKRLETYGNPDSRYGLISYAIRPDDLFKFDQLSFALRRLSIGLDWVVGQDWKVEDDFLPFSGQTYRQALLLDKRLSPRPPPSYPDNKIESTNANLNDIFYAWNFGYRRHADDLHKRPPNSLVASFQMKNSYLSLLWNYFKSDRSLNNPFVEDGVRWLIDSIKLDRGARHEFERLLSNRPGDGPKPESPSS